MAIICTYQDGSKVLKGATVKLDRIWGSKKEQWNAWVHVFSADNLETPASVFSVTTPFVYGENPYTSLYTAVGKLTFLTDIRHDVDTTTSQAVTELQSDVIKVESPVEKVDIAPKTVKKSKTTKTK